MRRTQASSLPSELTTDATKVDRKCVKMVVSSLAAMFDEDFFFFYYKRRERFILCSDCAATACSI